LLLSFFAATVRDEQATNTTHLLMSSTQHVMYAVTHNLQPTPATRYVMSAVMKSTVYRETASVSTGESIVQTASDETALCGNSTGHTGIAQIFLMSVVYKPLSKLKNDR